MGTRKRKEPIGSRKLEGRSIESAWNASRLLDIERAMTDDGLNESQRGVMFSSRRGSPQEVKRLWAFAREIERRVIVHQQRQVSALNEQIIADCKAPYGPGILRHAVRLLRRRWTFAARK